MSPIVSMSRECLGRSIAKYNKIHDGLECSRHMKTRLKGRAHNPVRRSKAYKIVTESHNSEQDLY